MEYFVINNLLSQLDETMRFILIYGEALSR